MCESAHCCLIPINYQRLKLATSGMCPQNLRAVLCCLAWSAARPEARRVSQPWRRTACLKQSRMHKHNLALLALFAIAVLEGIYAFSQQLAQFILQDAGDGCRQHRDQRPEQPAAGRVAS